MNNPHNFRKEQIALKDLKLWDENARFPDKYFNKPDKELISYFLSKKDYKIRDFAEAVVADFDLPQSEKLIVYDSGNGLVVLEGNRRVTAYKLLLDPTLTDDESLQGFFRELKSKIEIDENSLLECLVTEDKEQGLRYIDRKHANGNNEVGWGDTERAHYNKRRGNAKKDELFKIALAKVIKDLDFPEALKEQVLGFGFVTTFYRILNSSPAWDLFGFSLNDDGDLVSTDPDFKEKLKVIILNVLEQQDFEGNKINSRSLNKNEDIEGYLGSIKKEDAKKAEEKIEDKTQEDIFGQETIQVTKTDARRSNPKSTSRSYLIPKTCILTIDETKINNVYRELKDDLLLDDSNKAVPNAVGVLFRVFLEITLDFFLDKEGIAINPDTKLAGKITKVADHMETSNIATKNQLKNIRRVAIANTSILSIDGFHDYVHSYKAQPGSSDLKQKWDNLQEFFELLWNYIKNKSSTKTKS